jgi:predicted DNA-binding transcriptional regulator AlpA
MNYRDLLESGANVSVTVKLDDLKAIFKEVAGGLKLARQAPPPEEFLSRREVLSRLGIDSSTLWSWEKTSYIRSFPFGGRKRYKLSDVEAIRTGMKGGHNGK